MGGIARGLTSNLTLWLKMLRVIPITRGFLDLFLTSWRVGCTSLSFLELQLF